MELLTRTGSNGCGHRWRDERPGETSSDVPLLHGRCHRHDPRSLVQLLLDLLEHAHDAQSVAAVAARHGVVDDRIDEVLRLDVERLRPTEMRDVDVALAHA